MAEQPEGCARVTGTVAGKRPAAAIRRDPDKKGGENRGCARGQKAPDFTARRTTAAGSPR